MNIKAEEISKIIRDQIGSYAVDVDVAEVGSIISIGDGIAHAARWYFDKPVDDLSWAEIALLTAIPQSPTRMNPLRRAGLERAVRRGHRMLDAMDPRDSVSDRDDAPDFGDVDVDRVAANLVPDDL